MSQAWMDVRVVAKTPEADDIWAFELADPQGSPLPPFGAGAHIDVEVAEGVVRQYSLCNSPVETHRYLIAVLREPQSRGGSLALCDGVQIGDRLRISEPRNHFPLVAGDHGSVLIAGGIGVTPILCMAERLGHARARFQMHYGARSAGRMAFRDRILAAPFAGSVQLHLDDGPPSQRLDLDAVLGAAGPDDHLYVCGPAGLIEAALSRARALGWPEGRLHREFFAAPGDPSPAEGDTSFEIEIASTGAVYTVPADRPITDVLAQVGIGIMVSCQQGVCGTCLTRVLAGVPDHRDVYLTEEEQAANDQMLPCCSRARTPRLVLDL